MPPLTGLRMVARDTWFYKDATPTELADRGHNGPWHRWHSPVKGGIVVETAAQIIPELRQERYGARQMPPLAGLRMVARDTWFYNDAAPTELPDRAHDGHRL